MVMFGFDYPFMRKLSPKSYAEVDARAEAAQLRATAHLEGDASPDRRGPANVDMLEDA